MKILTPAEVEIASGHAIDVATKKINEGLTAGRRCFTVEVGIADRVLILLSVAGWRAVYRLSPDGGWAIVEATEQTS